MKLTLTILLLCLSVLSVSVARAADPGASDWVRTPFAAARLLAGGETADGMFVGVQIRLEPGWKTYWRVPGDAGVPPRFDWSASSNLADAHVGWPAPSWHEDEYATSIGYEHEVVFPVRVRPKAPGAGTIVRLDLDYAACKDICVPLQARLALDLSRVPQVSTPASAKVGQFREQVPERVAPEEVGLKDVRVADGGARLRLEFAARTLAGPRELIVEGPDKFFFGRPRRVSASGTGAVFEVPVSGASSAGELHGVPLRLTVLEDSRAAETKISAK